MQEPEFNKSEKLPVLAIRCKKCGKLLGKIDDIKKIKGLEIKCSRCKQVNSY